MTFEPQTIAEIVLVKPNRHADDRGFFAETYHRARYLDGGIDCSFVQDNHSLSAAVGTLRGFHFQAPPKAQDKLVRCTRGRILDVAVDIRIGSPSYLKSVAVELSAADGWQLFVPKGFAHAFLTLEPDTEVQYKVSNYYDRELDLGISWRDPDIAFDWPMAETDMILSQKDRSLPAVRDAGAVFAYDAAQVE